MSKARLAVGSLALSFAAFVGIANSEYFTEKAVVPTKGDRPTIGYGSTFWEDGRPVKMGETITPVRALRVVEAHINREEAAFRASLPGVELTQGEYDLYLDFTYNYGMGNWSGSSMRRHLIAGNYPAACHALLQYRKAAGYDCSTLVNGRRNQRCWGVWERQVARHKKCMGEQ